MSPFWSARNSTAVGTPAKCLRGAQFLFALPGRLGNGKEGSGRINRCVKAVGKPLVSGREVPFI